MTRKFGFLRPLFTVAGAFLLIFTGIRFQAQTPSAPPSTPSASPAQPMMLGLNYYGTLWKDNEKALLANLPLSIARWGGNSSDITENPYGLVKRFIDDGHSAHGSVPLYQVPFLFGERPQDEAKQVTDINISNKAGIVYWEIGNEPELFGSSHNQKVSLDDYLKGWRADAQAMLAADPSIRLVGPDVSLNTTPIDKTSRAWQWFDGFIKANGDLIQVVSIHFYPYGNQDLTPDDIFANTDLFAKNLTILRQYLHDTLKRDLPLWINETNISYESAGNTNVKPDGLFAGLWLADIIGISAEQGVGAVIPWTSVRNGGLSVLDDTGNPRPTYYAMQMFSGLGATVEMPTGLPDGVQGYSSKVDSGTAMEVLINRTDKPIPVTIGDTTVTLGAYSMTHLSFDASGRLTNGTTYGQAEYDAKQPPSDALKSGD